MEHFNQLTPAEAERLAMLAEECGEVIQIVGKILRHGLNSNHPNDPAITNRGLLHKELCDIYAVASWLEMQGDIDPPTPADISKARVKKRKYTHHQQ